MKHARRGANGGSSLAYAGWAMLLAALVTLSGWPPAWIRTLPDAGEYRQFATGGPALVHNPYSERVLHPLIVRIVAASTGISIDAAFLAVALAMLAAFVFVIAMILRESGAPAVTIVPLMFTPLLVNQFERIYFQDLTQWTLIAIFFLALMRKRVWLALAMLFLAYLTRESTLILSLTVIGTGVVRRDARLAIGATLATVLAIVIASRFGARGLPNEHHVNEMVFLILKLPFEFGRNVLGLFVVPSSLAHTQGNQCAPILMFAVPRVLRFTGQKWVSYCGFRPEWPLNTFSQMAAVFGICPVVLLAIVRRRNVIRQALDVEWLTIALTYGVLAYLVGTSEGTWLDREIGSGWPAFWIALPALAAASRSLLPSTLGRLAVYNLIVSWMPHPVQWATHYSNLGLIVTILIALAFQFLAYPEVSTREETSGVVPVSA